MNSFTLTAVGNLARNPELVSKNDRSYAKLCLVENCSNTLILRCAGSEHGGTSQFASRLIGEREVLRRQTSRGRDREGWFGGRGHRRSTQVSEQWVTETAVMASELEQLPDLTGYLKTASSKAWLRVSFRR